MLNTLLLPADLSLSAETLAQMRAAFPLALAGVIVWGLWLYRVILSARAEPVVNNLTATTSVVVPSFREDPDILLDCLHNWRSQDPAEIIVVLDLADTEAYDRIRAIGDPRVTPVLFKHAGKRSALGVGIQMATSDLLVLTDSDTQVAARACSPPCSALRRPRRGSGQHPAERVPAPHQRLAPRSRTGWSTSATTTTSRPWAARARWPACPVAPPPTGARVVLPVLDNLENEFFLGRRCVAGDDGRLTWLVLASGYKTVHQSSARALSMFPDTFRAFVKQRIRWSRNSYRCYLTARVQGLAVAGAVRHQGHRAADPADAGHDGRHPRLPRLQSARAHPDRASRWPSSG